MSFAPGTRLGPYEIEAPLGAGGMGEIWRARDTRLGRSVAIKVIPAHLSAQPEIRARFEREARTISSLNHPHICVLHDVGREGSTDYLVMELVVGESLAKKLERGPLPIGETLRFGAQIADALDRAHRAGIVHRDLKPANVMITRAGAKLMDFGLARGSNDAGRPALISSPGDASISPTMSRPLTAEGTIVGTFQYMSPEQLEGAEADSRSDLWGFGCMLYEMVTGKRAFEGRSQASLISAIMKEEPRPIGELAPLAPPELDRIVRRCLAKDPDERWQSAADLKHELQWLASGVSAGGTTIASPAASRAASRGRPGTLALLAAGAAGVLLATAFGMLPRMLGKVQAPAPGEVLRFQIPEPRGIEFASPAEQVLSPDGSKLAFTALDSTGTKHLYVRAMNSIELREIHTGEEPKLPFWSPDGRWIAYFADSKLQKTSLEGGDPVSLCDIEDGRGGSWSPSGDIVFAPHPEGTIMRMRDSGGEPVEVTQFDRARHERSHRYPQFLPDGRHFLYVGIRPAEQHTWYVADIQGGRPRPIGEAATAPVWSSAGYVLWNENNRVVARRFDPASGRLSGDPQAIDQNAFRDNFAYPNLTVAGEQLIMQRRRMGPIRLLWRGPDGKEVPASDQEIPVEVSASLSHDGKRLAYQSPPPMDIWLKDLDGGAPQRLTSHGDYIGTIIWSPDDRRFYYARSVGMAGYEARVHDLDSGADSVVARTGGVFVIPNSVTPDGKWLLLSASDSTGRSDMWVMPTDGSAPAHPWKRTPQEEQGGIFSPDGRWIATAAVGPNGIEVSLDAFPGPGPHYQVTAGGSNYIQWTHSGDGILLVDNSGLVSLLPVQWTPVVRFGTPRRLFSMAPDISLVGFAGTSRGYLVARRDESGRDVSLEGVLNWTRLLERH